MENSENGLRRRAFLGIVGAAGALGGLGCGAEPAAMSGPTDVGPVTDWPARTWRLLCAQNLIVGRDDTGLYALSAVCTHMGCTLTMASGACNPTSPGTLMASGMIPTLNCPCHQSAFNIQNGARVSGEAQRNLAAYQVTLTAGRVMVDRGVIVAGSSRTAVT